MNNNIFLYGGSKDPNFLSINSYIKKNNINYTIFTHNVGLPIDVIFDVNNNILKINNKIFDDKRVFIRNDIFSSLDDASQKLSSYSNDTYNLIKQFILFNEDIKILNRKFLSKGSANKVLNLLKAKEIGFLIPETLISSNIPQIQNFVSKFDLDQKDLHSLFLYFLY